MKNGTISISIVSFPYLSSNVPTSPECGIYISQLLRYGRTCWTYNRFLIRGNQLKNKLIYKIDLLNICDIYGGSDDY
jgi:hypothetical protein